MLERVVAERCGILGDQHVNPSAVKIALSEYQDTIT
jgi:hypothetical protein